VLTNEHIRGALYKCKMPVNQKQTDLLTSCLTKYGSKFNYLQMIALLFGNALADKTQVDHNIVLDED
jgi:hypothetical protein